MAIRYTHGFDLLYKVVAMLGGVFLVAAGADLLEPISHVLEGWLKRAGLAWIWIALIWIYGIGGYILAILLLSKTVLPHWLPTYLRVRLLLFTKISPTEASHLGFLFDGTAGGVWYPLGSIRKISSEFRREALFRFANKIARENGWKRPFEMPEDFAGKEHKRSRFSESSNARRDSTDESQLYSCLGMLGLDHLPSSFEPIKSAYRKKISEFHPDKFAGERPDVIHYAEEISKQINVAYDFLHAYFASAAR